MNGLIVFVVTVLISVALDYGIKPRPYRKWLGILIGVLGVVGMFNLPTIHDGFDPFSLYLVMCFTGMTLFCSRDRYADKE
ncbi:hypothetical protein N015_19675 [Pseudomonas asturiensis]|uniref:Holin n=1 Tax=Pseudomonas asturiensis TaxID=1190415 RepID=A0ABX6HGQ7_9PSED|nr:hypothetical protein [Pseudomonas asturiensis]QHF04504.1 hypothetical protein N015_19675 [Pseudomonas asturiensis]